MLDGVEMDETDDVRYLMPDRYLLVYMVFMVRIFPHPKRRRAHFVLPPETYDNKFY